MDLGLKGKVALVAGASKGLGRATAQGLAAEGVKTVICSRSADAIGAAATSINTNGGTKAAGGQAVAVTADVTKAGDIDRVVKQTLDQFGKIDILVTNAGGPPSGPITGMTDDHWDAAVQSLLLSVVRLCRAVVPSMQQHKWGRILHVASFTVKQPLLNLGLSNSVRLAVVGLAKTQAAELAPYNILVNTLCPGPIATDRLMELTQAAAQRLNIPFDEAKQRLWISQIPMGRLGDPVEFANLAVFLASERASFITGGAWQVDGGATKGPF